jgi:Big-like domain-containing protein/PKD domain-containing protein
MKKLTFGLIMLAALAALSSTALATVSGTFYVVTSTTDNTDSVVHGGTGTSADPFQMSSLRGAVLRANQNGVGPHTISVPAGLGIYNLSVNNPATPATTSTIGLPDLEIGSNLSTVTVQGTGGTAKIVQTIAGNDVITTGLKSDGFSPTIVTLTLDHLEITGGTFTGLFVGADDGAGNIAHTTITNCNIHDNANNSSSTVSSAGGAIFNQTGFLTISNTTFANNIASNTNGGIGGAIYYDIPNTTGQGSQGSLSITNCTFTNNKSTTPSGFPGGGAIFVAVSTTAGNTASITGCTFTGNQATGGGDGGAIANTRGAPVTITNCNFSGNQATTATGHGGAIINQASPSNLTVSFSRFAGNTAVTHTNGDTLYNNNGTVTANDNWWGINTGPPTNAVVGAASFTTNLTTWLQLRNIPSAAAVCASGTSTLTADIFGRANSGGTLTPTASSNLTNLPTFPASATTIFTNTTPSLGSLSSAGTQFVAGKATAIFTAASPASTSTATINAVADSQTIAANVVVQIPNATITPNPTSVCDSSTGNLAGGVSGMATYAWSITNGTITSATNIQNITYTAGVVGSNSGNVTLGLTVTTSAGCSDTKSIGVPINALPAVPTITPNPTAVCASSTGNQASGPAGATTYAWSITNGTITSATNIQTITYTAGSTGSNGGNVTLNLTVTNSSGCSRSNSANVTVNPVPTTPTITPNPTSVCASSTGNQATGPAGATTYAWSITNGTITSATNIQVITYTAGSAGSNGGNVTLSLTVTNSFGCSASNSANVTVNALPATPTITPSPTSVCDSSTGNHASGPAGASSYAWSITNGTITSATNIQTITYTAGSTGSNSGNVTLSLTVTNAAGCSASNSANVTINALPATPTITPNPSSVCASSTGNQASGPAGATTYAWSITNGTITSATNIQTITYTAGSIGSNGGNVTLNLTVTNASGCSASNSANVLINAPPATPTITPNPTSVCASSTGNQASGPAGATTYAWSITNGTITSATNIQSITYTAGSTGSNGGNVTLSLTVTNANGCAASNSANVLINASPATPTITPTPTSVCESSTGNQASGPAGATTYAWSITNGTITSATNIQTITYTAGSAGSNSGNVTLNLTVTNAGGCSASNSANVPVNALPSTPTITPNPTTVCANSTGNQASGPAGATTYAWSITNGTITSATNIQTITYTAGSVASNSGNVTLSLTVTNASGCSASNSANVAINPAVAPPSITPNPTSVCAASTGNQASGPGGATTYLWSITNGTITSATNIQTITYTAGSAGSNGGNVTLSLTVTNVQGCSGSNSANVPINASPATPTITPTPSSVCASSTGNQASGPAGATTYAWSITNGTITSATNIQSITYTAGSAASNSGNVTLSLTVTNGSSCSASNSANVTVNAVPSATITPSPSSVCAGSTGNQASAPGGASSYGWTITNGTITSATNIATITYTAGSTGSNGSKVTLGVTVTSSAGCSNSSSTDVTVNALPATPTITPNPTSVCASSTGNQASGPAGATTYAWSITNGTITSAANIQTITYTAGSTGSNGGNVTLSLTVTNGSSCGASNSANVPINALPSTPTITPSPTTVCAGSTGNQASGPAGATTYAWSITNGTITSATNIQTITYTAGSTGSNSGNVTLSLTVTNASGCSASNSANVAINASPSTPTITPNPTSVCAGSTGNQASGPAGATTYAWSITNGTITSATNIQTITYTAGSAASNSGNVTLSLTVTNASSCSASNSANVPVNALPSTPTITPNPTPVCAGSTGNQASGPEGATTYAWSITNGTITSATNIQTITYTAGSTGSNSGNVTLSLTVTNGSSCSASNSANVPINAVPAAPTITPNPSSVCASSTGNQASGPAGATTYAWSITNGTITSATNIQTITYTAGSTGSNSGNVTLNLTVTNASGCGASNSANVAINASPAAPTITPNPSPVCESSTGNQASGPAGATTYAWTITNGTITSATNIQTITYTAGSTGSNGGNVTLGLTVTNANGCGASNSANVTINPQPAQPTITAPSNVQPNSTGNTASGPAGATTYAWQISGSGTITSATNTQSITFSAGASGDITLTLTVTNAAGCSASNSVVVHTNQPPVAVDDTAFTVKTTAIDIDVLANDSDPNGDTLTITNVTQAQHGTVTIINNGTKVHYAPTQTMPAMDSFTYTISDGNGGTDTATVTVKNLFLAANGSYDGLATPENKQTPTNDNLGYLTIKVTSTGSFSATFLFAGIHYEFGNNFDNSGNFTRVIARPGQASLTLNLSLDPGNNQVTGTVTDSQTFTSDITAALKVQAGALAGSYTMLLPANPNALPTSSFPQGYGYAVMTVKSDGTVSLQGKLGDGVALSSSTFLHADNTFPVYLGLYADGFPTRGSMSGTITFQSVNGANASDAHGTLLWFKPANANEMQYPAGFSTSTDAIVSTYQKPSNGTLVLNFTPGSNNGQVDIGQGNIPSAQAISQVVTLDSQNHIIVTPPNPENLSMSINVSNGMFSGSFLHPVGGTKTSFQGVVFQKQTFGGGVFKGSDQTGFVELNPH